MAEFISGSEEAFVNQMNERAKELGMKNTQFYNCNGLDHEGHLVSAYDVALMSRELIEHHPQVHSYCTIWMDTIVHHTAKGSQQFGLNNTNKLIRQYEYSTGLKTGSTSEAGFCVSATAKKGNMHLIGVIMNGETSKSRFLDAATLLNYGFANYQIYTDTDGQREALHPILVKGGVENSVIPVYEKEFSYLLLGGESISSVEKRLELPKELTAPVEKDQVIGHLSYYQQGKKLGEVAIVAKNSVNAAKYRDYVKRVWLAWMM
jgi:D-alanyl-D-alanine carboxypeptidase (penicillin-binding protein 5/6)